jgi:hypothetical protein
MALKWRIYYGDGNTYDSSMGSPENAPSRNVQCIVEHDPDVGRVILADDDWYYFDTAWQRWLKSDIHGLLDKLLERPAVTITGVMSGRSIQSYREVIAMAQADPDFPLKSSVKSREVRR